MRTLILFGLVTVITAGMFIETASAGDKYIKGYFRKDGTYVEPYQRSAPDRYKENNRSNRGW